MDYFSGRIAVVTGAASGLGRAICHELARRGAGVVAADINEAGAESTARVIGEAGGKAQAAVVDVTDRLAVRGLIRGTASRFKRLDFVFNNAGIGIAGRMYDMEPEHWRRIIDINLMGVIYGTDEAYRIMVSRDTDISSTPPPWPGLSQPLLPAHMPPPSTRSWAFRPPSGMRRRSTMSGLASSARGSSRPRYSTTLRSSRGARLIPTVTFRS